MNSIMRNIHLLFFFIALFLSCRQGKITKKSETVVPGDTLMTNTFLEKTTTDVTNNIEKDFDILCSKIDYDITIEENDIIRYITLSTENSEIKLATFFAHEYTYLIWKESPPIITSLYFTHEIERDDIKSYGIFLFKCDTDIILVLYCHSEELMIREFIKLSDNGTSESLGIYTYNEDNEELEYSFSEDKFTYSLGEVKGKFVLISKVLKGETYKTLHIYDRLIPNEAMPVKTVYPKVESYLNIRSLPNTESSQVIGKAYVNDKIFVLGDLGDWSIIYSNGIYGYVSNEFIK